MVRRKLLLMSVTVLLAIFVTVATLIGLEFILRYQADQLPLPSLLFINQDLKASLPLVEAKIEEANPWARGVIEDPDLGWTFQPNFLAEGVNEDGEAYSIRTSSLGFYTPDEPEVQGPHLIVLGDSFLSTFYVKKPIAWVLRAELNRPVYNLAVGGWGPESYRVAYNKFVKRKNSAIVAVFSFNNDITDVDNWHGWKASDQDLTFRAWLWQNDPSIVNRGNKWLDRHSVLWNLAKFAVKNVRSERDKLAPTLGQQMDQRESFVGEMPGKTFQLQFTKGYQFMNLDPEAFSPGGSYWPFMNAYFDSLDRLRADIKAHGSEMVLIWIPSKERVYLPLLPEDQYRKYVTNVSGEIDGLELALQQYAQEQDIHFLDLTPELMDRARRGEKLYFTVDGHLNSLGNRVVGELSAVAIRDLLFEDQVSR